LMTATCDYYTLPFPPVNVVNTVNLLMLTTSRNVVTYYANICCLCCTISVFIM